MMPFDLIQPDLSSQGFQNRRTADIPGSLLLAQGSQDGFQGFRRVSAGSGSCMCSLVTYWLKQGSPMYFMSALAGAQKLP